MNIRSILKYYPLVSEVFKKILLLIKGEESKENTEHLEKALLTIEEGMKQTEKWIIKRERDILIYRWIVLITLLISVVNFILIILIQKEISLILWII